MSAKLLVICAVTTGRLVDGKQPEQVAKLTLSKLFCRTP
jgi:hypothetical protein